MSKSSPRKAKAKPSSLVKNVARVCTENRQTQRIIAVNEAKSADFIESQQGHRDAMMVERLDAIKTLMEDNGVQFLEPVDLTFVDSEARGGVEMGLNRLAYNPDALRDDLTVPWCGVNLDPASVVKFLDKDCRVPKWALRLKQATLSGLTVPNTEGMLTHEGKPNKDLRQLIANQQFEALPSNIESLHLEEVSSIAAGVLTCAKASGDSLFGINQINGRIRLRRWTENELRVQMKKAFNSSSPGYPYNRYKWDDVVDGQTVVLHALNAFEGLIADGAEPSGFVFFQQSRATGDGGSLYEGSDATFGQQRLVQAAPLAEKVIGHILAYVFKLYIKQPLLSGQNGIQQASRELKRFCQEKISLGQADSFGVLDYDVSQWDVAQIDERMKRGFFAVCDLVFDQEDEFTARLLSVYKAQYFNRRLVTGVGQIRSNFLPSGSSITTVCAFVQHLIQVGVVEKYGQSFRNGKRLFHEVGLQGDDNISIVEDFTDEDAKRIAYIYTLYGCTIKGGEIAYSPLSDPDCAGVFLNEAIRVRDPIDIDMNAKFPRWSLFWAENRMDATRGPNIDRMLMDEIRTRVPHPTETELTFVSFTSKMDRFSSMPFYRPLLVWLLKRSRYPMRSWLGERVCNNSPTMALIKALEEERNIEWPSPELRANDRREEIWANSDELSDMACILWMLQEVCPEAKEVCRSVHASGKNSDGWKRSRKAMEGAGLSFAQNSELKTTEVREFISRAYSIGYKNYALNVDEARKNKSSVTDLPDAHYEAAEELGVVVSSPVVNLRTLIRGILSLNETNPWKLRYLVAQAIISAYHSPGWNALQEDTQQEIEAYYKAQYGLVLTRVEGEKANVQHLRQWLRGVGNVTEFSGSVMIREEEENKVA